MCLETPAREPRPLWLRKDFEFSSPVEKPSMQRLASPIVIPVLVCVAAWGDAALAISPQNPYRSFNLSGINYGSMQWERAQREGKRVWPYSHAPSPASRAVAPQPRRGLRHRHR